MSTAGQQLAMLQAGGARMVSAATVTLEDNVTRESTWVLDIDRMNADGTRSVRQETLVEDKLI